MQSDRKVAGIRGQERGSEGGDGVHYQRRMHMNAMMSKRRGGFTLIELLVVIAIIAVLVGLAPACDPEGARVELPDLLQQQPAADRRCLPYPPHRTRLFPPRRQRRHFGAHVFFDGPYIPLVGTQQQAGWGFQILPYVEGTNAWNGGTASDVATKQSIAIGTPNKVFFCAARRGPTVWVNPADGTTYRRPPRHDRLRRQQLRGDGRGAPDVLHPHLADHRRHRQHPAGRRQVLAARRPERAPRG